MSNTLRSLDAEWRRLARSPRARRALSRWATTYPALDGLADLEQVLERRRDPAQASTVLSALAALAANDELAARTLLQALLPGLVRIAFNAAADDGSAIEEMVSLAWERIRTYPTGRPGSVVGNILLDVKKRYRQHRRIEAPRTTLLPESRVLPPADADLVLSAEDEVMRRVAFVELLQRQRKLVGDVNARAIVRTRLVGMSLAEVAAEENLSVNALTFRRWWAERRLSEFPLAS
jgi:hypothetical protein